MTRDHSLVNDYLLAMPEQRRAESELPKNVITRALGRQDHVTVACRVTIPSSAISTCCARTVVRHDGDESCGSHPPDADLNEACRKLVQMAMARWEDNITAVIVRIEPDPPERESIKLSDTCLSRPG